MLSRWSTGSAASDQVQRGTVDRSSRTRWRSADTYSIAEQDDATCSPGLSLRFGRHDVNESEVLQALHIGFRAMISSMPSRTVWHRGSTRGGRQPVRWATATRPARPGVILPPTVLLAVDPTSAVDATEASIVKRLVRARQVAPTAVNMTLMLAEADQVHLLATDRLVASGTHASLMRDDRPTPPWSSVVKSPTAPTWAMPRDDPTAPDRAAGRRPSRSSPASVPIGPRSLWSSSPVAPPPRRGCLPRGLSGQIVDEVQAGSGVAAVNQLHLVVVVAAVGQFAIGYCARCPGLRFGERTSARLRERLDRSRAGSVSLPRTIDGTGDLTSRATACAGWSPSCSATPRQKCLCAHPGIDHHRRRLSAVTAVRRGRAGRAGRNSYRLGPCVEPARLPGREHS